ncbi:MAG: TonB-dependent receptor [Gammaproteobacteria bacterium]
MKYLTGCISRPVAVLLGLSIIATAPLPVIAQSGVLEEVVVTARYREEALQDTPIAITALSAADIEVRGFTAAYEIGYTVPNASLRPAQAAFGNTMSAFIRGIGQYDFAPEFEPGVAIYFDDVLHPVTMGSMVDLMDLERVEVLRGPQGTLFGRGALGGAIRYVSKKPEGDNTGYIQATTGAYDRVDIRAGFDFALTENVFARVTGVSKDRDGHQNVYDFACKHPNAAGNLPQQIFNRQAGDCKIGTQGGEDVKGVRGVVRWQVNNDLEFSLTSDYMDDGSEARADTLVALIGPSGPFQTWSENYVLPTYGVRFDDRFVPGDIYSSYATYRDEQSGLAFKPQTSLEQWGVSGTMDWNVNDILVETILSYREFNGQFATDADQSPINEQLVDGRQQFESFTGEVRFSGRAFDRLDWTVGGFYYDGKFTTGQTVSIPAFIFSGVAGSIIGGGAPPAVAYDIAADVIDNNALFLVNGLNIVDSENISVFAHGVFDLTDRLAFTAGVRYSEDTKDEQFDNTIVVTTDSAKTTSFDWKVGLDYKVTDDVMAYTSVATGYRPKAFNPRPFQVTQFVPVEGEENTSYELGIKGDFLDRSLRLNVAGFYIDYSKRILPVGGTECVIGTENPNGAFTDSLGQTCDQLTSRTFYDNIPADVYGAEVEAMWRPVDNMTISGTFGYTKFKGDEFSDPSLIGATDILSDRPIYVPEYNWSVAATYNFHLGNGATITPRVDVYGQSSICPSLETPLTVATVEQRCAASYELVNARIEYATSNRDWIIAFGVNNLTDKEYFLNKFDLSGFGQPTIEGQPGRPMEWFAQVRRNFN